MPAIRNLIQYKTLNFIFFFRKISVNHQQNILEILKSPCRKLPFVSIQCFENMKKLDANASPFFTTLSSGELEERQRIVKTSD